jgi:hypothetical protein
MSASAAMAKANGEIIISAWQNKRNENVASKIMKSVMKYRRQRNGGINIRAAWRSSNNRVIASLMASA